MARLIARSDGTCKHYRYHKAVVVSPPVVSGVDSQFLLPISRREQPAQVMGHSILMSRDGPHGPHRALLLSEFPLPRGRRPRRGKPLLPWLERQGPTNSSGLLSHLQALLLRAQGDRPGTRPLA